MTCSGSLLSAMPYSAIYASATGGAITLYKLDLAQSDGSAVPTQLGTFSTPVAAGSNPLANVCPTSSLGFNNLTDPTSMFFVLHVTGGLNCHQAGTPATDQYYLIHYTDTASTAPLPMPVEASNFYPLWEDTGALSGIVLFDPLAGALNYYAGSGFANGGNGFTNPKTLLTGVTGATPVYPQYAEGSVNFFIVSTASTGAVYRFSNSPVASLEKVYSAASPSSPPDGVSGGLIDDNNVYFIDHENLQATIVQAPLIGNGSALPLITIEAASGVAATTVSVYLAGSTDSTLVYYTQSIDFDHLTYSSKLATIPTNVASSAPTPLGGANGTGTYGYLIYPRLFRPAGSSSSDAVVFLSGQIITLGGKVLSPNPGQAGEFVAFVGNPNNPSGAIQITAQGALSILDTTTLVATPLMTAAGTQFEAPNYFDFLIPNNPSYTLQAVSPALLTGYMSCQLSSLSTCPGGTNGIGVAIDLSKSLATTINAPDSNVVGAF
jgi:hypothetical protein